MKEKVKNSADLKPILRKARTEGKKVVFTNGCFDLLHRGHLHLLREAKKLGDLLVVAVNSDQSVKKIKGSGRPVLPEAERLELIAALEMVDYVVSFEEPDPYRLIRELEPDVLVKGGDWPEEKIVGRDIVAKVAAVPYLKGHSTTQIIERIRKR